MNYKEDCIIRNMSMTNYTTVDNYFIKDKNISTNAKGLLIQLLALPDTWKFSVNGIVSLVRESKTYVESCMKELKKYGYIEVNKFKSETGRYVYEYKINSIPIYCEFLPDGNIVNRQTGYVGRDNKYKLDVDAEVKDTEEDQLQKLLIRVLKQLNFEGTLDDLKRYLPERLQLSNRTLAKLIRNCEDSLNVLGVKHSLRKTKIGLKFVVGEGDGRKKQGNLSSPENLRVTEPAPENHPLVSSPYKTRKNALYKREFTKVTEPAPENHPLVSSPENSKVTEPDPDSPGLVNHPLYKSMNNKMIYRLIEKEIKEQINYEQLKSKLSDEKEQKLLDDIVSIMTDVNSTVDDVIRIGKEHFKRDRVLETFKSLDEEHIVYVIQNVLNQKNKIQNVYSYLLKSLFTAPKSFNLSKYSKTKGLVPDWYADTAQTPPSKELLAVALERQRKLKEHSV